MNTAVLARKIARLKTFLDDLKPYTALTDSDRRAAHYAIERLLQLLCEASADIALQVVKRHGIAPLDSYRGIFMALATHGALSKDLAERLALACGMRNVLTHLYDDIDLDRVVAAVEPAVALYSRFLDWAVPHLEP